MYGTYRTIHQILSTTHLHRSHTFFNYLFQTFFPLFSFFFFFLLLASESAVVHMCSNTIVYTNSCRGGFLKRDLKFLISKIRCIRERHFWDRFDLIRLNAWLCRHRRKKKMLELRLNLELFSIYIFTVFVSINSIFYS